ncbi:MAG TPA: hypothetical protein PLB46_07140 [Chitinophagales bacterium]|nr:hypothetical protein [Chitinophagales bacterium]
MGIKPKFKLKAIVYFRIIFHSVLPKNAGISFVYLSVYEKNKKWDAYIQAAKSGAEKYLWNDANSLRRISDMIYDHSSDKSTLVKAANFAVRSAELKPEYFNNLSAAKIYFKLGYNDLSKKYAQQAIAEGKKKNMNTVEAENIVTTISNN